MYFAAAFLASLLVSATASWSPKDGKRVFRRQQHASLAKLSTTAPGPVSQPFQTSAVKGRRLLRKRCAAQSPAPPQAVASSAMSPASSATKSPTSPIQSPASPLQPPAQSPTSTASRSAPPQPTNNFGPNNVATSPELPPSSSSSHPAPSPAPGQSGSIFSGTQTNGDGTSSAFSSRSNAEHVFQVPSTHLV